MTTAHRWSPIAFAAVLGVGCTPIYTWDINTTSTARPPSFDVAELSREPVSAGEVATASEVLRHDRIVPVDEIAQKLWRRMIQHDLLEGGTGSRSLLDF